MPKEQNARRPRSQRATGVGLAPISEASLHFVPCAPPLPPLTLALLPDSLFFCRQVCRRLNKSEPRMRAVGAVFTVGGSNAS